MQSMMFDWQPGYSVGFAEIDALHKGVFQAAGELHAAVVAGKSGETLGELLARLASRTRAHFEAEEALMQASQYPEAARHKTKHVTMTDRLLAWERDAAPDMDMLQGLQGALIQHIDEEDRELGRYLANRTA